MKYKHGEFEGPESVVRRVAVGIINNKLADYKAGRSNFKLVNGKLVKQAFDRMPSPSSFGGGIAMKLK